MIEINPYGLDQFSTTAPYRLFGFPYSEDDNSLYCPIEHSGLNFIPGYNLYNRSIEFEALGYGPGIINWRFV